MPGVGKRFMNVAARAAFERMMRHNPRAFEMNRLRISLREHMERLAKTGTGRQQIELIEEVLKAMQEGHVRSREDIDRLLKEELGVNVKFNQLFPADAGRSVNGYLSEFNHPRRGPLR